MARDKREAPVSTVPGPQAEDSHPLAAAGSTHDRGHENGLIDRATPEVGRDPQPVQSGQASSALALTACASPESPVTSAEHHTYSLDTHSALNTHPLPANLSTVSSLNMAEANSLESRLRESMSLEVDLSIERRLESRLEPRPEGRGETRGQHYPPPPVIDLSVQADSLFGRLRKQINLPGGVDANSVGDGAELSIYQLPGTRQSRPVVMPPLPTSDLPFPTEPLTLELLTPDERRLMPMVDEPSHKTRYQLRGEELGRGGMGQVVSAYDSLLHREVAVKLPLPEVSHEPAMMSRLKDEPRLTARLEHPNIVPVYDLVVTPEGRCGYVMRKVDGERLSEILKDLHMGRADRLESYGRVRLLTILNQVVAAVAFAHDSRIVHRDLKPNNIMLGKYGQVLLLDWGLAMNLDSRGPVLLGTESGGFVGAPAYISPEQLAGDITRMDERSDIYSLGAILYEILTWVPPFVPEPHETYEAFLERVQEGLIIPPTERAPERRIPPSLEETCLKCLARSPKERYQTAMELLAEITAFLEGTREQEWRRRAAERKTDEARAIAARYEALHAEARQGLQQANEAQRTVLAWEPLERKRKIWNLQRSAQNKEKEAMEEFNEAEKAWLQAIGHDADYLPAKDGLAELYLRRFLHAEASRNLSETRYFEARVRAVDQSGRYTALLRGSGHISLKSRPSDARFTLFRLQEQDRVLTPAAPRELGLGSVETELSPGSYLVTLEREGFRPVRYPIYLGRLDRVEANVRMYTEQELGEDFVYVPAGYFRMGGDPEAFSLEIQICYLDDFAIGRVPVTVGQYLQFLNALAEKNLEAACRRAPRTPGSTRPLWDLTADNRFVLPSQPDSEGHSWHPLMPILNVSYDDAMAYIEWRSAQDQRAYRLPSAAEWEKAARGTDGRLFPWGDEFEATYCKNRDSQPSYPFPDVVGQYPQDCSPYGVRDMAGGVSEMTPDLLTRGEGLYTAKGGNWTTGDRGCRLARNIAYRLDGPNPSLGFRLCFSLQPAGGNQAV